VRAFATRHDPDGVIFERQWQEPRRTTEFQLHSDGRARIAGSDNCSLGVAKFAEWPSADDLASGRVVVLNSGTQYVPFSRSALSWQIHRRNGEAFYPSDRRAGFCCRQSQHSVDDRKCHTWLNTDETEAHRTTVATLKRLRLPSPTYPGFVRGLLCSADWQPTTR
jgi:hypothetical protein